jgi:hypothetical protein
VAAGARKSRRRGDGAGLHSDRWQPAAAAAAASTIYRPVPLPLPPPGWFSPTSLFIPPLLWAVALTPTPRFSRSLSSPPFSHNSQPPLHLLSLFSSSGAELWCPIHGARACSPQAFLNCQLVGGFRRVQFSLNSLRSSLPVDGSRKPMETMPPPLTFSSRPVPSTRRRRWREVCVLPGDGVPNYALVYLNYAFFALNYAFSF